MEETEWSDIYRALNEEKRERHAQWWDANTKYLNESGVVFRVASHESYLFRQEGKPKVDFYPSTGRWRDVGTGKTYRGGAQAFVGWYKKQ